MPLNLSVTSNVAQLTRRLSMAAYRQIPFATAQAINDVVQDCRRSVPAEMKKVFDSPTPYTLRSLRYDKASKAQLSARVWIDSFGTKGIAPATYLEPEATGGARRHKRFEAALRLRQILPPGMFVTPAEAAPKDRYGNVPGTFYALILSYLGAFGEQGYRANMTPKRKAKIANAAYVTNRSGREYKVINGAVYFVADRSPRSRHLKRGIYRKTGIHGSDVAPVFLFVNSATYSARFDFDRVVTNTVATKFDARMSRRLAAAIRTAR